jgi:hypothetical protein
MSFNININMFGAAYGAQNMANMLRDIGGPSDGVWMSNHKADLVGLLSGNSSTGGTMLGGNLFGGWGENIFWGPEALWALLGYPSSAHNSYGGSDALWGDNDGKPAGRIIHATGTAPMP